MKLIIILLLVFIIDNVQTSSTFYVVPFVNTFFSQHMTDGSLKYPFSNIIQARNHVRKIKYLLKTNIIIELYPTYHFLLHTFKLINEDSGQNENQTITYTKMNKKSVKYFKQQKEKWLKINNNNIRYMADLDIPIISGGIIVDNWEIIGNIWRAILPRNIGVNQLFIDGIRSKRSRLPSTGYYYYDQPLNITTDLAHYGFIYQTGQFDNISSLTGSEFIVYHSWTTSRHYFSTLFPNNRTILFSNPSNAAIGDPGFLPQSGKRFFIENINEAMLQEKGSFYFDTINNCLYYNPIPEQDPTKVMAVVPILETIIEILGTAVETVKNLELRSIAIEHSSWTMGKNECVDYQAASFLRTAAIYINYAQQVTMDSITISHLGGYALYIEKGCNDIMIDDSLLNDLGAGGIRIGNMMSESLVNQTSNIIVQNNSISDGGHVFPMGIGVLIHRASNNSIIENTIHHFYYTGISIGWSWGYDESDAYSNLITSNYIHHIGQQVLCDLGGIYTLGISNGTNISNNVIHDIYAYSIYDWGIYLDEGTSNLVAKNNIIYNTGWAGFEQHYGFNNTIVNNVFARSGPANGEISLSRREDHLSFTFKHNIIYDTINDTGRWIFQVFAPDPFTSPIIDFDYNCYYSIYSSMFIFGLGRLVFSEWQETQHDMNSLMWNPFFIEPDQCNFFNISSNSQAVTELGFTPIPMLKQWIKGCN